MLRGGGACSLGAERRARAPGGSEPCPGGIPGVAAKPHFKHDPEAGLLNPERTHSDLSRILTRAGVGGAQR